MTNGPAPTETRHLLTLFSLGAAGTLTDGQLLERFANLGGDPGELAFAALVDRHGPMVFRVARSALVDEHSAHDAFQATFLILARKARSLWVRDSLGPWLHAVAYRVASRSRSVESRRRLRERAAASPEAYHPRPFDQADLARSIHEEIERLPHPYRLAVVTCHLEGLTQQEAAARLGWPVGTLQSRLARGRQRLRDALRRRGLAPSPGLIGVKLAPVPQALIASTSKLAATLRLGGGVAGMIPPTVLAMIETTTKGMLMTKLKLGALAVVMACGLVASGVGLGVGRPVRATESEPIPVIHLSPLNQGEPKPEPGEPTLTLPIPRPWETVVRIRLVTDGKPTGQHSGTIVQSTPTESVILTTAHDFASIKFVKSLPQSTILVDLFDGKLTGQAPATVHETERDIPAELIDLNFSEDVGLIRIRPGRQLLASPVIPPNHPFTRGMGMLALGCSLGNDASAWDTTILDFWVHMQRDEYRVKSSAFKCMHRPKEGRSGGGLFTTDGHVAGVYSFVDPDEQAGLYATPGAIHRLLDRNGLTSLYWNKPIEGLRPSLDDSKASNIVPARPGVEEVDIHGFKYPASAALLAAVRTPHSDPATLAPSPPRPVSDQDRRLDEVERKLEQVLKALEGLKGDRTMEFPIGDYPRRR